MRLAFVLVLATSTTYAEPSARPEADPQVTLGVSAFVQRYPTGGFHLAGAVRVWRTLYVDAQTSIAAHARSRDSELRIRAENVWSAQAGASSIRWGRHGAGGIRASLGYAKHEVETYDVPEDITITTDRDAVYLEAALFARLRLGSKVALEALFGARFGLLTRDPALDTNGCLSAGLHITI